jgi:hypothetical protein
MIETRECGVKALRCHSVISDLKEKKMMKTIRFHRHGALQLHGLLPAGGQSALGQLGQRRLKINWYFGARTEEQNSFTKSLVAPNFTLPDMNGKRHSLRDFRGKKVLLLTWASW